MSLNDPISVRKNASLFSKIGTFSPAAYRRFAPIGDCLLVHKKQLDLVFPFASISSKRDLNTITVGTFV
jgi:hypothetical protein